MDGYLRIFLVGQIAIVPFMGINTGELTVVVPELRSDIQHPHYPLVVYECKNATQPCDFPKPADLPSDVLEPPAPDTFGARLLSGENMKIVEGPKSGFLTFAGGRSHHVYHDVIGELPDYASARDFSWIPNMTRVSGTNGAIHPALLSAPVKGQVAARLYLSGFEGSVSTFGFADLGGEVFSFTFRGAESLPSLYDDKQAVADVVLIEIPLDSDKVKLRFRDFQTGKTSILRLKKVSSDRNIDIVVANIPRVFSSKEECKHSMGEHFALYGRLLETPSSGAAQIPVRGHRSVERSAVEPDLPDVLAFVEGPGPCFNWFSLIARPRDVAAVGSRGGRSPRGLSNRPICAEAVFTTP